MISSAVIASLIATGCSEVESMTALKVDPSMPVIKEVKTIVDKTSVGFEWSEIQDKRVEGVDVYRAVPGKGSKQRYVKIAL